VTVLRQPDAGDYLPGRQETPCGPAGVQDLVQEHGRARACASPRPSPATRKPTPPCTAGLVSYYNSLTQNLTVGTLTPSRV